MTINREHLAGLELAHDLCQMNSFPVSFEDSLEKLIAQAQAAPEAEPVAFMYSDISDTEEYLRLEPFVLIGGDLERHAARAVQGVRSVTPLYTATQHDAELVERERANAECFRQIATDLVMKVLILTAPGDELRRSSADALERIDAKLATLSAKNEGGKA